MGLNEIPPPLLGVERNGFVMEVGLLLNELDEVEDEEGKLMLLLGPATAGGKLLDTVKLLPTTWLVLLGKLLKLMPGLALED